MDGDRRLPPADRISLKRTGCRRPFGPLKNGEWSPKVPSMGRPVIVDPGYRGNSRDNVDHPA